MASTGALEDAMRLAIEQVGGVGECVLWLSAGGVTSAVSTQPGAERWPFPLGSVSRFVTAAALVAAEAAGELSLTSRLTAVDDCLPRYANARVSLLVEDVLRHRTGLSIWAFAGTRRDEPTPRLADLLRGSGRETVLHFEHRPLARTIYSSGAFALLELELTRRLGSDTANWLPSMVRRVDPSSTVTVDANLQPASAVVGYAHPALAVPGGSLRQVAALSQGLWGTGDDLVNLLRRIAADIRQGGVLSLVAQRRHHPRMALSTLVHGEKDDLRLSHQGYVLGFNSQFLSVPYRDLHVVLFTSAPIAAHELNRLVDRAITSLDSTSAGSEDQTAAPPRNGTYRDGDVSAHIANSEARLCLPGVGPVLLTWSSACYSPPGSTYPRLLPRGAECVLDDGHDTWVLRTASGGHR